VFLHRHRLDLAGVVLAAVGAIAFSGKAIIVKLAFRYGADPVTLIALRMLFAFPLFAASALWVERRGVRAPLSLLDAGKIVALGFLGYYLASFLDFLGLAYITATLERLILYLNPSLVLLLGALFLARPASRRQLAALGVSYCGVVIALAHDFQIGGSDILLGSLLVFASALAYALYLVGSGELVERIGSIRLTSYASCIACVLCVTQFVVTRPLAALLILPAPVYWLSCLNGIACTVLPVFAVMLAIARIGAARAAQIGMIGPVSTILLSSVFLGEPMGPWQLLGTLLVLAGVFLVSQRNNQGVIYDDNQQSHPDSLDRRPRSTSA
jgi:drug/metabolite transporter (DMT)-like permease